MIVFLYFKVVFKIWLRLVKVVFLLFWYVVLFEFIVIVWLYNVNVFLYFFCLYFLLFINFNFLEFNLFIGFWNFILLLFFFSIFFIVILNFKVLVVVILGRYFVMVEFLFICCFRLFIWVSCSILFEEVWRISVVWLWLVFVLLSL